MSTYGTTRHRDSPAAAGYTGKDRTTDYHTTLFRRLTWEGTVPLEIRVDPKELPANSDRGLECYFIQAPRVSYLPLLMPEIRRFLMDVVFDEAAAKVLREEDWWFESEEGTLLKWHWPIGLIYDNHAISASVKASSIATLLATPMRLVLHLASPPTEKLLLSPSAEACKQAFMGQLKEADFIRWGNTKRMTGLRKADQDGIWEGIKERRCSAFLPVCYSRFWPDNFDDYWRVASKVTPTTAPTRSQSPGPPPSSASMHGRPPSADPAGPSDRDGAFNVRSVPVRVYLPDGPVLQDLVPPLVEDGSPHILSHYLSNHIPLLFPPRPPTPPPSRTNPKPHAPDVPECLTPPDSEMAWLGACMAGADGWLNICVGISK
ncbi:autophagy protein Apg5-domain-containing protein [Infundibulicybe gibba]|nr:autophagy protein Apg5-domain-containing protein [Infundibulicybe gibba]